MTDWTRLFEFYERTSQRKIGPYADFGENMLRLIKRLQKETDLPDMEVDTAMYNLILWDKSSKGKSLHIGWQDGLYLLSIDGFKSDALRVSETDIIPTIKEHLNRNRLSNL